MKKILKYPKLIKINKYTDKRGYFSELYNPNFFMKNSIIENFVQDNVSFSKKKGTLRGLHLQIKSKSQSKLLKVNFGKIFDVCVDLRSDSKTFGRAYKFILSSKKLEFLYIPKGFAHGFLTLEDKTEVLYKVDNTYSKKFERTLIWNDNDLKINWPQVRSKFIISDKDKVGKKLNFFRNKEI